MCFPPGSCLFWNLRAANCPVNYIVVLSAANFEDKGKMDAEKFSALNIHSSNYKLRSVHNCQNSVSVHIAVVSYQRSNLIM